MEIFLTGAVYTSFILLAILFSVVLLGEFGLALLIILTFGGGAYYLIHLIS